MMDRILLVMPTRGRPWAALESIASAMKNSTEPSMVKIVVCCDDDDFYGRFGLFTHCSNVSTVVCPRRRFVEWLNAAFLHYQYNCEWIGWLSDDIRYTTPGWDSILREHKELVVWGHDGYQNEKMATHPWIRTVIPKSLGYLLPKELVHGPADLFIQELATEIGSIAYEPRITTEHLHPDAGKGTVDQTYLDARAVIANDLKVFEAIIRPTIPELAKKVVAAMK